jgi:hypothetical protein
MYLLSGAGLRYSEKATIPGAQSERRGEAWVGELNGWVPKTPPMLRWFQTTSTFVVPKIVAFDLSLTLRVCTPFLRRIRPVKVCTPWSLAVKV